MQLTLIITAAHHGDAAGWVIQRQCQLYLKLLHYLAHRDAHYCVCYAQVDSFNAQSTIHHAQSLFTALSLDAIECSAGSILSY